MIVVHTFSVCNVSFSTLCFPLPLIPFFFSLYGKVLWQVFDLSVDVGAHYKKYCPGPKTRAGKNCPTAGQAFLGMIFFLSFSSPIVKNVHLLDVRSRFKLPSPTPPPPPTIFCVNDLCCVSSLRTPWPYLPLLLPVRSLLTPIHLSACGLLYQHQPCPLRNP